ncbi:MAG: hypothetical protein ACI4RJ_01735, partial [Alphaproteobacteria bacterium]
MGLFSSSSKSSSTTYNQSQQMSSTFGDLAHDNLAAAGDLSIYTEGLAGENLQMIFDNNSAVLEKTV